jgi:hypothetical protein
VKQQTSTLGILGELGQFPLKIQMLTRTIKYWIRLVNLPDNSIIKQMYQSQLDLHNIGHHTWVTDIQQILHEWELSELWEEGKPSPRLAKFIRGHMESVYHSYWTSEINNSNKNPKLRLYKAIKNELKIEPYLYINIPKYRHALSKLRLSSHHLEIETGRHARPIIPSQQRYCKTCKNIVGDEIHFLTECSKYNELRTKLYDDITPFIPNFTTMTNRNKCITLLSHSDIDVLLLIAKFTYTAWKSPVVEK